MKKLTIIGLLMLAFIGFNSCSEDDDLVFTAVAPEEGVVFVNTFLPEYILTPATAGNLAERFTWSDAYFDVPTPVTYELQKSLTGLFDDENIIVGSTGNNELGVSVGQMLGYAAEAGLDNDPETEAPNTGEIYFRVRAYVGLDTDTQAFTPTITLNMVLPDIVEDTGGGGIEISEWGVVGSGYNDWGGAGPDGAFYTTATAGVIVSYVTLIDGEIKFRTNNDWGSGDDIGASGTDGFLENPGSNIPVSAGNYRITINTNDNSYTIEEWSWGVVGSGYNNWGDPLFPPDAKFYYDYTTDTFKVGVKLIDGEIKFRSNNDWSSGDDLGAAGTDGFVESPGSNIAVTEGHYLITINFNTNEYSIEETDVWGVVGSGYNNWGGDGDDFALTEIQENVFYGDVATLIDGEVKFRTNNDWGSGDDLGAAGTEGFVENPGSNIAVDAGLYRVRLDLNDNSYQLNKIQ
jgi:hypothetical protein